MSARKTSEPRSLYTLVGRLALLPALALDLVRADSTARLNFLLHAAGPAARPATRLGWSLAAIAILVTLVVAGLLVGVIFR